MVIRFNLFFPDFQAYHFRAKSYKIFSSYFFLNWSSSYFDWSLWSWLNIFSWIRTVAIAIPLTLYKIYKKVIKLHYSSSVDGLVTIDCSFHILHSFLLHSVNVMLQSIEKKEMVKIFDLISPFKFVYWKRCKFLWKLQWILWNLL